MRIPSWLRSAPEVRINGQILDGSAAPGSYLAIRRAWRQGDRVDVALPMHLHVEPLPDDPHMQAFLYGPLVLAGDLGNEGLTEAHISGPNLRVGAANIEQHGSPLAPVNRTPAIPDLEIPMFHAAGRDPSSWIERRTQRRCFARRTEAGRDAAAAEQVVRQTLLGVLAGHLSEDSHV